MAVATWSGTCQATHHTEEAAKEVEREALAVVLVAAKEAEREASVVVTAGL